MQTTRPSGAGEPRQKRARGFVPVIAQEVGRLAHLRNRVRVGLAGLAHDEADERVVARFEDIGGAAQHRRPFGRGDRGERGRRAVARLERRGDLVGARVTNEADDVGAVGRIEDRLAGIVRCGARRKGAPSRPGACGEGGREPGQASFVGEIDPARVDALRRIKVARRRDLVVRRPERLNCARDCGGVGDEIVDGEARIGDAVDERGVGAVLEQAADQIGEQRLVRADRRVDPARPVELAAADHLLIERLAHAVQALEFVLAAIEIGAGENERGSQRLRIVGGELRIDGVGRGEQLAGASEVAHVGVNLAGEHRKAVEAVRCARLISESQ